MKRLRAIIVTGTVATSAIVAFAAPSSADNEVNSGACKRDADNPGEQAHGQTGNGPLTIVHNSKGYNVIVPNGFDGAVGCDTVQP